MFRRLALAFAAVALVSLSACGKVDRVVASVTGSSQQCVEGVMYIQFTSGASVKYLPDGKIATCR